MLDEGYGKSQGYYDQASGLFDPYMQQGGKASGMYSDLLGLNGADARSSAQGVITSDPLFQGQFASDSNAMLRAMNKNLHLHSSLSMVCMIHLYAMR